MDESTQFKTCSTCGELKPLDAFHKATAAPGGRMARCRICRNAATAAMSPERRAKVNARRRAKRDADLAEAKAARQKYREANLERIAAKDREYREANAERIRQRKALYSATKAAELSRKALEWQRVNPEKASLIRHRRRARRYGGEVGPIDAAALWTGSCALCDEPMDEALAFPDPASPSLDHIIPLSRGGGHVQSNLQWTHLTCNLRKGAKVN